MCEIVVHGPSATKTLAVPDERGVDEEYSELSRWNGILTTFYCVWKALLCIHAMERRALGRFVAILLWIVGTDSAHDRDKYT